MTQNPKVGEFDSAMVMVASGLDYVILIFTIWPDMTH